MKKKILTTTLCITMISLLAACGKQVNKPKETAKEESSKENKIETAKEPVSKEPEKIELTADTIDKYFGFEYTDTADEAISAFSATIEQSYGTEVISVPKIPIAYSASGCPSTAELADKIKTDAAKSENDVHYEMESVFNTTPFDVFSKCVTIWPTIEFASFETYLHMIHTDGSVVYTDKDYQGEFAKKALAFARDHSLVSITPGHNKYDYSEAYAIIAPDSVMTTGHKNNTLLITNHKPEFASVDDAEVTGLVAAFDSSDMKITVGGLITADSTIKDVVAKFAPTEGTLLENGAVVLTWKTAKGTTVEITFSLNEYKAMSVKILSPDMTPEILHGLKLN